MWAKHYVFMMDGCMHGWMVDGCSWLVWCLTIMIRTVNTKTYSEWISHHESAGKRGMMALHDILIAFSIISDHSTWGGGTIPRHGQCGPTVAAALPSLVPRLVHHPHLPTTPPGHFSRRGSPCRVRFRRILLYSSSSVSRYLTENCN